MSSFATQTGSSEAKLEWSVTVLDGGGPPPPLDLRTYLTRTLFVPAGSLRPDSRYLFQLTAQLADGESGVETVEVQCVFGPVVAVIDGGSRTVSAREPLVINASKSYDLDAASSSASNASDSAVEGPAARPFAFAWSCATPAGGACFDDSAGLLLRDSPTVSLPAGALVPGAYVFRVNATKEPGPRLDWDAVTLWVVPDSLPPAGVDPLPTPVVNPGDRLVISGRSAALGGSGGGGGGWVNATSRWTQVEGDAVAVYPDWVSTPLDLPSLSFRPGALSSGQTYAFRFTVTAARAVGDAGGGPRAGFAEVRFRVNTAPTSGTFEVAPTRGAGLVDVFTLACRDWVDELEDLPLTYEFRCAGDGGMRGHGG
jgi:hypothetical protein